MCTTTHAYNYHLNFNSKLTIFQSHVPGMRGCAVLRNLLSPQACHVVTAVSDTVPKMFVSAVLVQQVVVEVMKGGRPALPPVADLLQELCTSPEPSSSTEYGHIFTGTCFLNLTPV